MYKRFPIIPYPNPWLDLSAPTHSLPRSTQYWSDVVQSRLVLFDGVLQQVPPSALSDTAAFDLVEGEMGAIKRALHAIGTRRNALTPTCRIPVEILAEIFLIYQLVQASTPLLGCAADGPAGHTLKNTTLRWVPGVAHVCRHWRAVALAHPRLWSNITLSLGSTWALRMLALSKSSPISIKLSDPNTCESNLRPPVGPSSLLFEVAASAGAASRRPPLDPVDVLAQHLFHIRELELTACSCSALPWVRLLETVAPLLEVLRLCVEQHPPRIPYDVAVPLPSNFLATHPHLRRLSVDGALLSSWAIAPGAPLASLTFLSIHAPDPRKTSIERANLIVPTLDEFLDSLLHMPALETVTLSHCLPSFARAYSQRTAPLPHLRTIDIHDRVDRCQQVVDALDVPPTAIIKVSCWSVRPVSELDCLRILPSLSAHLRRHPKNADSKKPAIISPDGSGPRALSLSSTSIDGHTEFILDAWRSFVPPTLAEDRNHYFGPKGGPDVRLECEWDANDNPEMERRALRRACAGVPLDELRALSVYAEAAVWGANDWYEMFVESVEITHVSALEVPGGSVLDALKLPSPLPVSPSIENIITTTTTTTTTNSSGGGGGNSNGGSSGDAGPPLFPELVSLTLAGVNLVRANEAAWKTFLSAMAKREVSPMCVTILDRVELRGCNVAKSMIDYLKKFAAVVVWDSVTDPDDD